MFKHEKNFFSNFFKKNSGDKLIDNSNKPFLFALYDSKITSCMDPFVCPSVDYAKRSIQNLFDSGAKSLVTTYPGDFTLWCLGEWQADKCKVMSDPFPICSCLDFYSESVDTKRFSDVSAAKVSDCDSESVDTKRFSDVSAATVSYSDSEIVDTKAFSDVSAAKNKVVELFPNGSEVDK